MFITYFHNKSKKVYSLEKVTTTFSSYRYIYLFSLPPLEKFSFIKICFHDYEKPTFTNKLNCSKNITDCDLYCTSTDIKIFQTICLFCQ